MTVKLGFTLAAALALSGCVSTRYVTSHCLTADQVIPAEPPKIAPLLTGRADADARTLAASAVRLRAWGQGLAGILEGCRSPK